MLFILASDSQLRIVFFHSHVLGGFMGVEKEKLADNLTETVLDFLSGQSDCGCHAEQTAVNASVM